MQIAGGYRYPGTAVCAGLTVITVLVSLCTAYVKGLPAHGATAPFFSLEGTVLLASAFTPTGLVPPQGGVFARLKWFFTPQGGVAVKFAQPWFYHGLLALFFGILPAALVQ